MAEYLVLIYSNEESWASTDEAFSAKIMEGHGKFGEKHGASLRGGNALEPSMTATSVRTDASGKSVTTDGPFAETKEVLGGYYLLDAPDLDTALEHAARVPNIAYGSTEVRPVLDMAGRRTQAAQAQASA